MCAQPISIHNRPFVIYGCPTSGKSTALKSLRKRYWVVDTDFVWQAVMGFSDTDQNDRWEERLSMIQHQHSSADMDALNQRVYAVLPPDAVLITNMKSMAVVDIAFTRTKEVLEREWEKRSGSQNHPQWMDEWLLNESAVCLREGEYISDYLPSIVKHIDAHIGQIE